MLSSKMNIESFTGLLAVGSIGVLGVFLIVDGRTNIYVIFEEYGKVPLGVYSRPYPYLFYRICSAFFFRNSRKYYSQI